MNRSKPDYKAFNKLVYPKVGEYKSFEDKETLFHQEGLFINDHIREYLSQLEFKVNRFSNNEYIKKINHSVFFRGVSEAKYCLYNSAQVYYIKKFASLNVTRFKSFHKSLLIHYHYDKFISILIEETKKYQNGAIKKLFDANNIPDGNILAYLSYMQHYGVPTPLLDFTQDFYLALFFAIDNQKEWIESDNEIENYFSLYLVQPDLYTIQIVRKFFDPNFEKYRKTGAITYNKLAKARLHVFFHNDIDYYIINNKRIINQKGLFIYNSQTFIPVEFPYIDMNSTVLKNRLVNDGKNNITDEGLHDSSKLAFCYNIHKSLIPEIREILNEKGITKQFVYPDNYNIRDEILEKTIIRLNEWDKRINK